MYLLCIWNFEVGSKVVISPFFDKTPPLALTGDGVASKFSPETYTSIIKLSVTSSSVMPKYRFLTFRFLFPFLLKVSPLAIRRWALWAAVCRAARAARLARGTVSGIVSCLEPVAVLRPLSLLALPAPR